MATRHAVVLLPGIVLPAESAFAALLKVLGERVDAVAKELEVYAGDEPPPGYGLGFEVDGVLRTADAHGFGRFHLVGYSAGGAVSLAFTSAHGDRLLSLALLEPAWAGNDRTPQEERVTQGFRALAPLPPDEFMSGFQRLQLAPGVDPPRPPEGQPPAWMAEAARGHPSHPRRFRPRRPRRRSAAGVRPTGLFRTRGPQQPDYSGPMAERLAATFSDFTIETFPERHHFDPPHRVEPEHLADSLLRLWQRAEQ